MCLHDHCCVLHSPGTRTTSVLTCPRRFTRKLQRDSRMIPRKSFDCTTASLSLVRSFAHSLRSRALEDKSNWFVFGTSPIQFSRTQEENKQTWSHMHKLTKTNHSPITTTTRLNQLGRSLHTQASRRTSRCRLTSSITLWRTTYFMTTWQRSLRRPLSEFSSLNSKPCQAQ